MTFIDTEPTLAQVRSHLDSWADRLPAEALAKAYALASSSLGRFMRVSEEWEGTDEPALAPLGESARPNADGSPSHADSFTRVRRSLQAAHTDPDNAFTVVHDADALRDATELDGIPQESRGPMWGMPIAVKDNIDVRGWMVTAGSWALNAVAEADAPAIAALRAAGAVPIGQTNMDELAWGGTTNNPRYGPTTNPRAARRSVAGSSGGAAAAVAAGVVPVALGTDTGGSVRLPAAAVGVVGFRPSTGLIDATGIVPLAKSYDTIGVIGRDVDVVQCATEIMAKRSLAAPGLSRPLRLGVIRGITPHGTDPLVTMAWKALESALRADGIELHPIDIGGLASYFDVWFLIHLIEPARAHAQLLEKCSHQLGSGALVPLLAGAALPDELLDQAQRLRAAFNAGVDSALIDFDAVLAPTIAFAPPMVGAESVDLPGGNVPLLTAMPQTTWLSSMAGLPAASIPIHHGPLPVGCQVIARRGHDAMVFLVARDIEQRIRELRIGE